MNKIFFLFAIFGFIVSDEISVFGSSRLQIAPNSCYLNFSIVNEGENFTDAKNKDEKALKNLNLFIQNNKIANNTQLIFSSINKKQIKNKKIFVAYRDYKIYLPDIKNYEIFVDKLTKNVKIDSLQVDFLNSDIEIYKEKARNEAVKIAKQKAQNFAKQLDRKLDKAINLEEINSNHFVTLNSSYKDENLQNFGVVNIEAKIKITFRLE